MQTISIKYNHIHWIITLSFSDFNQARSTKFSKWLEVPIYLANLLIRRVLKQQWRANNARWRATTCNVHRATWTCALTLVVAWVRVWVLARKCTAVRYDCIYMHPISAPASGRVYVSVRPWSPLSLALSPSLSICPSLSRRLSLCAPKTHPLKKAEGTKPGSSKARVNTLREKKAKYFRNICSPL